MHQLTTYPHTGLSWDSCRTYTSYTGEWGEGWLCLLEKTTAQYCCMCKWSKMRLNKLHMPPKAASNILWLLLTWLIFSDSGSDTLNDPGCLVTQDCWEALFSHTFQEKVQICMAHSSCHNLHQQIKRYYNTVCNNTVHAVLNKKRNRITSELSPIQEK